MRGGGARYKYIHMEEMLGNVPGARQIFERWTAFEPDHHGWMAYIKARARPAALAARPSCRAVAQEPLLQAPAPHSTRSAN